MECGETLEQAAARETFEETGVRLDPSQLHLHAVVTLPEISQVYVGFLATTDEQTTLICGPECTEVRFFSEADVPWDELAYSDIGAYLKDYFGERRIGTQIVHFGRIDSASVISKSYRIADVTEVRR